MSEPAWPELTTAERRVLGVLIEKQKTTPDAYPMTLNALITGCNQKNNRDPLLNLSDIDVEDTLIGLHKRGWVTRVVGGRSEKWRHLLYEQWAVGKVELAVLAELLLRGPQTEGELRGRASRMDEIADLDQLRDLLKPLAGRSLVVYLTPEGRRGTVVTHGFHAATELAKARQRFAEGEAVAPAPMAVESESAVADLRKQIDELRLTVNRLETQVRALSDQLGVSLSRD